MLTLFRSQSRIFLAVLLVVIGLSFIVFYNIPSLNQIKQGGAGKIDGRVVTVDELGLAYQAVEILTEIRTGQRAQQDNQVPRQAWNRLLMLSAAGELGIEVSDAELTDAFRQFFANEKGQYDPASYDRFAQGYLANRGLSPQRFEQILREEVALRSLTRAVTSTVYVQPGETESTLQKFFGSVKFSLVKFPLSDFAAKVQIKPEEINQEYKENAGDPAYRTLERRQVHYVSFRLGEKDVKKTAEEKKSALDALRERAVNFAVDALGDGSGPAPDFAALATKASVPLATTQWFAANQAPVPLPPSPAFNRAAFQLTPDQSTSDVVEGDGVYYVLKLVEVKPSELRPQPEVQAEITQRLRERGARQLAQLAAQEALTSLKKDLATGVAWKEAVTKLKLKPIDVPEFSPVDPKIKNDDLNVLVPLSQTLSEREVSAPVATANGFALVYLEKRGAFPAEQAEKMAMLWQARLLGQKRGVAMEAWLKDRQVRPGTKLPDGLVSATE